MGVASGIELGCSYELGSGWTRIGVLTRPRWGLGMVMTLSRKVRYNSPRSPAMPSSCAMSITRDLSKIRMH